MQDEFFEKKFRSNVFEKLLFCVFVSRRLPYGSDENFFSNVAIF